MAQLNHPIDNSPTLQGIAGEAISAPALLAVKFDSTGGLVLPDAGDPIIGIVLADEDGVGSGDPLNIQIKDITYWIAGGTVATGASLKTDASGKCVTAEAGDVVNAIALSSASSGKPCKVLICHTTVPAAVVVDEN